VSVQTEDQTSLSPEIKTAPKLRARFIIALAAVIIAMLGYVYIPNITSYILISVIEWRAKVDIQYDKKETRGLFWVKYHNLSVQRTANVKVSAGEATIQYNVLDLIWKRFDLKLYARDIKVVAKEGTKGKTILDKFEFTDMDSTFRLASKRRIRIDFLRLSGPMGSIFVKGRLQEKVDIDMTFGCYLSRDFLLKLPKFIQENLFKDNELPLKHFTFSMKGEWFQPSIDFQSDLIQFNFTAKDQIPAK